MKIEYFYWNIFGNFPLATCMSEIVFLLRLSTNSQARWYLFLETDYLTSKRITQDVQKSTKHKPRISSLNYQSEAYTYAWPRLLNPREFSANSFQRESSFLRASQACSWAQFKGRGARKRGFFLVLHVLTGENQERPTKWRLAFGEETKIDADVNGPFSVNWC